MAGRMSPDTGTLSTLDACLRIEETCAAIYREFARSFAGTPDVARQWEAMSQEEEGHAEEFRRVIALHGRPDSLFESENYLIEAILEHIDSLHDKVRRNPPELKDAYVIAMILEQSIEKYHTEASSLIVNPTLAALLAKMAAHDQAHLELLKRAAEAVS